MRDGLHPGGEYFLVKTIRLVGMMLIVYVRDEIKDQLRDIYAEQIGTGLLGRMVRGREVCLEIEFLLIDRFTLCSGEKNIYLIFLFAGK